MGRWSLRGVFVTERAPYVNLDTKYIQMIWPSYLPIISICSPFRYPKILCYLSQKTMHDILVRLKIFGQADSIWPHFLDSEQVTVPSPLRHPGKLYCAIGGSHAYLPVRHLLVDGRAGGIDVFKCVYSYTCAQEDISIPYKMYSYLPPNHAPIFNTIHPVVPEIRKVGGGAHVRICTCIPPLTSVKRLANGTLCKTLI